MIDILDYMPYNKSKAKQLIINEFKMARLWGGNIMNRYLRDFIKPIFFQKNSE